LERRYVHPGAGLVAFHLGFQSIELAQTIGELRILRLRRGALRPANLTGGEGAAGEV